MGDEDGLLIDLEAEHAGQDLDSEESRLTAGEEIYSAQDAGEKVTVDERPLESSDRPRRRSSTHSDKSAKSAKSTASSTLESGKLRIEIGRTCVYCIECGTQASVELSHCPACQHKLIKGLQDIEFEDEAYDPFAHARNAKELVSPPLPPEAVAKIFETRVLNSSGSSEIYTVRFKPGNSGLEFDEDWLGKALVVEEPPEDFFLVKPEQRGVVHRGDFVIAIEEEGCLNLSAEQVQALLEKAQNGNKPYHIRFRKATKPTEAFAHVRPEAVEALSMIYKEKSKVYEPPEHMDMVYGYILRYRGERTISFHFFREADDKFMLAAVMPTNGKGRLVFHNDTSVKLDGHLKNVPLHSESAQFLGSMVNNFMGTQFVMHDYRVDNPTSTRKKVHHELGCVMYDSNVFGRVPNSLTAVLPRWDPELGLQGQSKSLSSRYTQAAKKRYAANLNVLQKLRAGRKDEYRAVEVSEEEEMLSFETMKPSWNEEVQAWTLNFNGRVKMASKKNFMLVPNASNEAMDEEFGADTVCLRFGKVTKDRFALDYRHPISPFQAFAIALTSFSNKLVVT